MKSPAFWRHRGLGSKLLTPFTGITRRLTARRLARPGFAAGVPVICIGNAGVGGAGKTILALDILHRMPGAYALTRGYGGNLPGPLLVDPARHNAIAVGDEALLLAAAARTILARDRAAGGRLAVSLGASGIVMDDGLQNPGLVKTLSLLVIDGGYGFGNGLLLPAGPLREPVAAAAARCQAAVLIGDDTTGALAQLPPGLQLLRARLVPSCGIDLAGRAVVAFAGIGRPEKFFASVIALGGIIHRQFTFPDHHRYSAADARRLAAAAGALPLLTTAKDFVKLPAALQARCTVVAVSLAWDDETALTSLLP